MQEISIDYFIRLVACQGKFFDLPPAWVVPAGFAGRNGLLNVFSVVSMNIYVYIMGKFAIIKLPLIVEKNSLNGDFISPIHLTEEFVMARLNTVPGYILLALTGLILCGNPVFAEPSGKQLYQVAQNVPELDTMDQGKGVLGGEENRPVVQFSEEGKKRFEPADSWPKSSSIRFRPGWRPNRRSTPPPGCSWRFASRSTGSWNDSKPFWNMLWTY